MIFRATGWDWRVGWSIGATHSPRGWRSTGSGALYFGRGPGGDGRRLRQPRAAPDHPQLLDWLAWRFMESGWDVKACTSSSSCRPRIGSRRCTRRIGGPRSRQSLAGARSQTSSAAEQIRDEALAVSGLLSGRLGGPSVGHISPPGYGRKPERANIRPGHRREAVSPQPLHLLEADAPPPNMLTFDATSREVCTAKRETTSTPLQALILLNDPQYLEAARVLAEQVVRSADRRKTRGPQAFRCATGRAPDAREREVLRQLYASSGRVCRNDAAQRKRSSSRAASRSTRLACRASCGRPRCWPARS